MTTSASADSQCSGWYRLHCARRSRRAARAASIGPQHKRRKVTDAQILTVAALGLSVADSAKRLGITPMGYHKRARRLGITSEVYKQQRKLTARYIADFARWIRAQGSLPVNDRIIEHHAQMCAETMK